MNTSMIKVWDPFVRLFHWALVGAYALAYVSGEDWLTLHVPAGYVVGGLLLMRILWGFIGTEHARFSDFVRGPSAILGYLKEVLVLRPRRYIGHNPVGGAMIIAMITALLITCVTGLVVYGADEGAGPLAGWLAGSGEGLAEATEEVHEFFANLTLVLVFVHVAGVLVESLLLRENLVRAMFTGRKRAD